jgi:hypothetical protein
MGNILFLVGITLLLGPQRTFVFFARKQKWKGTLAFWAGVLLILMKWPLIGFGVELFGIFVLFGVSTWSFAGRNDIAGEEGLGLACWGLVTCWLTRMITCRSSSRRSLGLRIAFLLLDLIWLGACRLLATRLEPTTGRTRTCRCRSFGFAKVGVYGLQRHHEAQAQVQEWHNIRRSCMRIWKRTINDASTNLSGHCGYTTIVSMRFQDWYCAAFLLRLFSLPVWFLLRNTTREAHCHGPVRGKQRRAVG